MAGVKGKSGGARPNTGGSRPGAGRKKKEAPVVDISSNGDPKKFLVDLMNSPEADVRMRVDAAKALMPFVHQKLGEGGKKEERQEAAKKVAGRFSQAAPPKLVAAGGKKV